MAVAHSCLYRSRVIHKRVRPARHHFSYKVFSIFVDLSELADLDRKCRLFSFEHFNILSFRAADHGRRDGSELASWAVRKFEEAGIAKPSRIKLLCFPRLFGYVFNPLSIYYGYDEANALVGIIYEVKNTFGEQHCYVLPVDPNSSIVEQACRKRFYVSPFLPMEAFYHFLLRDPGEKLLVSIRETTSEGPLLIATQDGTRRDFSDRELLKCLLVNSLMTFKVFAGIHWEALRLWLKRVPLVPRVRERETTSLEKASQNEA